MTMRLMLSSALSLADAGLVTVVPGVESKNATFVEEFVSSWPSIRPSTLPTRLAKV